MIRLIITCLLFISALEMSAQKNVYGIKGGINFSTLVDEDSIFEYENRTGFQIGIVRSFKLNEDFSIMTELMYSKKGAIQNRQQGLTIISKYDYISLPIFINYNILSGLSLQAGPELSFLINAKIENVQPEPLNLYEFTKVFDFGLGAGLQYLFRNDLFLNVRYTLGLLDINDFAESNTVLTLSAGYFFL